jgi:hypothetical protein
MRVCANQKFGVVSREDDLTGSLDSLQVTFFATIFLSATVSLIHSKLGTLKLNFLDNYNLLILNYTELYN